MKKILTTAILCAGLTGFTACDSFLDEEPKSSITDISYYKTEDQIIANVNSMYRTGATDFLANMTGAYRGSSASVSDMLTGYFSNDFGGQEVDCSYAHSLTRQDHTAMTCTYQTNNVWRYAYSVINRANGVIKNIGNVEMTNASRYKAEAQFFRALNYFYLVKMFGDVPMITEPTEGLTDESYPTRTAKSDIYTNVIVPDLKEAVSNLPAATFAANGHRVTKYAAEMVLADVYMMLGQYADAASLLKDVINNSGATLTANTDMGIGSAYNILRENDDLPEVIWAYEYDGSISNTGNLPTHAFNGDAEKIFTTYTLWVNVFNVSDQYLNVYEDNDLRIQPNQFFHWTYTNPNTGETWSSETACNWYWHDENAVLNTSIGTKDWNFYRLSEALLSAAECIAQSEGVTAEAAGYLAQVKARANMEGKTVAAITAEVQRLGKQAFIEECWTERLRELPLEMKHWNDCLRTQKFPVISKTEKGKVTYVDLIGATNGAGATFKATDLVWPIPVEEIQRNPNLTQNEGYSRE
ncbi:RagB/SusD family nutrient uptake outer membrane protein [Parabacteroides sp.]|uniref:RagB/SusD family nutrient uptake outer membrane protein n=1 Tax=Parabacteroides sp. TaxID=1869337 RepID=UPI0025805310|nr:RagB/SusD family nutrient uptake outer membrane protein [Parabacteroides sp.]